MTELISTNETQCLHPNIFRLPFFHHLTLLVLSCCEHELRENLICFSRESRVSKICNSNFNLSLTDVEPKYPVQCSEDGNWRIPTENDDRANVEGNFTSCNVSTCYHVKPTSLSRNINDFWSPQIILS